MDNGIKPCFGGHIPVLVGLSWFYWGQSKQGGPLTTSDLSRYMYLHNMTRVENPGSVQNWTDVFFELISESQAVVSAADPGGHQDLFFNHAAFRQF